MGLMSVRLGDWKRNEKFCNVARTWIFSSYLAHDGHKKQHQFSLSQVKLDNLNTSTLNVTSSSRTFRFEGVSVDLLVYCFLHQTIPTR
jgi:hypothetical protein